MAIKFHKGFYVDTKTGKQVSRQEAYTRTGLCNTEAVVEYAEAKAVRSAERADNAEYN